LAMSKSSGTVTAPIITPRFANVRPNEAIDNLSEAVSVVGVYSTWSRGCEILGRVIHHEGPEEDEGFFYVCLALLSSIVFAACQIIRRAIAYENTDLLAPSRQDAKFGNCFLPLRLCVFARDSPIFGCGSAALSSLWLIFLPRLDITLGAC
jgi:hypothetical protein